MTVELTEIVARCLGTRLVGIETVVDPTRGAWLLLHLDNAVTMRIALADSDPSPIEVHDPYPEGDPGTVQ
jgi:hypothetical protein